MDKGMRQEPREPTEGSQRPVMWVSLSLLVCVCVHLCNAPLTPIPSPTAGHKAEVEGGHYAIGGMPCVSAEKQNAE